MAPNTFSSLGNCEFFDGHIEWKNDNICDDVNNNEYFDFDGGDCCGANVKKQFCFNCSCICKYRNSLSSCLIFL